MASASAPPSCPACRAARSGRRLRVAIQVLAGMAALACSVTCLTACFLSGAREPGGADRMTFLQVETSERIAFTALYLSLALAVGVAVLRVVVGALDRRAQQASSNAQAAQLGPELYRAPAAQTACPHHPLAPP